MKYTVLFLLSFSAMAAIPTYDLKIKVQHNNDIITPRVMVKSQEVATTIREIGENEKFVDVVVTEKAADVLRIKFAIGTIIDGERVIQATPEFLVHENQTATMTTTNEDEGSVFVSVNAQKIIEEE